MFTSTHCLAQGKMHQAVEHQTSLYNMVAFKVIKSHVRVIEVLTMNE
jgi:hypothetical protein